MRASRRAARSILVPATLNLGLQVANTWGGVWPSSSACYLVGTLIWVYSAALVFAGIILHRPDA
ncbi:MAG: hypothetical protein CL908_12815 [Deltaproteobacteria bacterium]|nr:hypothetical protein [Deltaproteobacteria bacterium]